MAYQYLAITLFAAFGFGYGMIRLFWKRKALYTRMIIFGVGCAMMGRMFETISLFAFGSLPKGFDIGMLGIMGSFLFFFTANFGSMDSLVDNGSAAFRKFRIAALAAPAVVCVLFAVYLWYAGIDLSILAYGTEALIITQASYYHLKHIIIEDVDFGLIRSVRGYNCLALIYAVLCMLEMILDAAPFPPMYHMVWTTLMCIVLFAIVPVLEKGVTRWTM